jgi:hypothetical protein
VKFKDVKYFSKNILALTTDRTVLNMLELMVPFLVGLWMHAIIISSNAAGNYGFAYLVCRAVYPFAYRLGIPWLFMSTIPNYICILLLVFPVFLKAISV